MHTIWKASAGASPPRSADASAREKTPPITTAIQISPTTSNRMPATRSIVFIVNLLDLSLETSRSFSRDHFAPRPSRPQCLDEQPQGQNRSYAMESIPGERPTAQPTRLAAEHVRHDEQDSGRRDQPHHGCRNPPQHAHITSFPDYRVPESLLVVIGRKVNAGLAQRDRFELGFVLHFTDHVYHKCSGGLRLKRVFFCYAKIHHLGDDGRQGFWYLGSWSTSSDQGATYA